MTDKLKIPFNKKRILILFLCSFLFILAGLCLFIESERFVNAFQNSIIITKLVGSISVLFFGLAFVSMLKKLIGNSYALIIDEKGIVDNASGVCAGLVEWKDITETFIPSIDTSQQFIYIHVKNPKHYIERKRNIVSKLFMKANYKFYGTPITIPTKMLGCDHASLEKNLSEYFSKYYNT